MKRNRLERLERFATGLIQEKGGDQNRSRSVRLLLWVLLAFSRLYEIIVQTRHFLYDHSIFRDYTLGCQVISVGNLTVGGTGKTPVVEVFARELARNGRQVAILSRGYKKVEPSFINKMVDKITFREKRRSPRVVSNGRTLLLDSAMSGDEPYMLASNLPDVSVVVDRDRVKSGRYAINRLHCDTLILDDGFQYRSLKHWVEIVLVDRTNPFGNEHVLPRGILREPVRNIRRADFIFVTKSDGSSLDTLKQRLRKHNTRAEIIECRHCARYLQNIFTAERKELSFLNGLRVISLSGIASPGGFEKELERQGARILHYQRFADHHRYTQQEIINAINKGKDLNVDAIITTEKDAVRFPRLDRRDVPIYFLRVDIEILSGEEDFHACIARICFRPREQTKVLTT